MELQEIYKKFREIAEELNEKDNIQIEKVSFDWLHTVGPSSVLIAMDIDTRETA